MSAHAMEFYRLVLGILSVWRITHCCRRKTDPGTSWFASAKQWVMALSEIFSIAFSVAAFGWQCRSQFFWQQAGARVCCYGCRFQRGRFSLNAPPTTVRHRRRHPTLKVSD